MDDLPPPPQQQQPSADIAEEGAAAAGQLPAERDAEAERAAFLAATDGFAFEGPVVVLSLNTQIVSGSDECLDPYSARGVTVPLGCAPMSADRYVNLAFLRPILCNQISQRCCVLADGGRGCQAAAGGPALASHLCC